MTFCSGRKTIVSMQILSTKEEPPTSVGSRNPDVIDKHTLNHKIEKL